MNDIKPGDHIVIEGSMYDSYIIARVVKVGKTMWEIEQVGWRGEYGHPVRRKVYKPILYTGNNPAAMAKTLNDCRDEFWSQKRERERKYHARIAALPGMQSAEESSQ